MNAEFQIFFRINKIYNFYEYISSFSGQQIKRITSIAMDKPKFEQFTAYSSDYSILYEENILFR